MSNEVTITDPLQKYVVSREGKFTAYCIPKSVMIDFKISVLKKSFQKFEAVYHLSQQYYEVYTESL